MRSAPVEGEEDNVNLHNLSGSNFVQVPVAATPAAGTATADIAALMQPFDEGRAKVVEVYFVPAAAVAGANTNSRTLNLRLPDGTVIATLAYVAGVNTARGVRQAFTLTGTEAQRILAIGAALTVESALVGTGLALPAGSIVVGFEGY